MRTRSVFRNLGIYFLASRPKFLTASAAPVLVGTALASTAGCVPEPGLFVLALLSIMALHAGANIANDYFDHVSGNDWVNINPTPFSGGRRFIQEQILSARATLALALLALAAGAGLGIIILVQTRSVFILTLGVVGLAGGFFYTAPPLKLGYRSVGEMVIAVLFGLLPVYGSYYLQSGRIDSLALLPAAIVSALIFLVILANEFPDLAADAAVNKHTIVVRLGVDASIHIYRLVLAASYVAAVVMLAGRSSFYAGLLYLLTCPLAVAAARSANRRELTRPGWYRTSQLTVLLHILGSTALACGFFVAGLVNPAG